MLYSGTGGQGRGLREHIQCMTRAKREGGGDWRGVLQEAGEVEDRTEQCWNRRNGSLGKDTLPEFIPEACRTQKAVFWQPRMC